MHKIEDIILFIENIIGANISPEDDIFMKHHVFGDDFHELINKYSKAFHVDMKDHLWYFHSNEEGHNHSIGSNFFKPPYERVIRIPVTARILWEFANNGKWDIKYPTLKLPSRRWDIVINQILVIGVLLALVLSIYKSIH